MYNFRIYVVVTLLCISHLVTRAQYNGNSQFEPVIQNGVAYTIAAVPWDVRGKGNHRAIVYIKGNAVKAVKVSIPWRRADLSPADKKIVVVDVTTGKEVKQVYPLKISNEEGVIAFQPVTVPGNYEIYYLPAIFREKSDDARYGKPWNDYLPADYAADKEWVTYVKTNSNQLPLTSVRKFESRTRFDFFTAMGLIATRKETEHLSMQAKQAFMVFPEDRAFPIRLEDHLPLRWVNKPTAGTFSGTASRNEYYTFQLGIWAFQKNLQQVKVTFSDLKQAGTTTFISRDSITCFNQEGINWNGQPVKFDVNIPAGKVRSLWIGVAVPQNIRPGIYSGWAQVTAAGAAPQKINLQLKVTGTYLPDRGDDDLWRHARLRWLNSTLGLDDEVVSPYKPIVKQRNVVTVNEKQVVLNDFGLPAAITVGNKQLLAAPLSLVLKSAAGPLPLQTSPVTVHDSSAGRITWSNKWTGKNLEALCNGTVLFDGTLEYKITLKAAAPLALEDAGLQLSFPENATPYLMGIGLPGGYLPALPYTWDWKGPWNSCWLGDVKAGLHVKFLGADYDGPLLNDYKPAAPDAWSNNGKGSIKVSRDAKQYLLLTAATGSRILQPGTPVELSFRLLITPVKQLDPHQHFSERYYQGAPQNAFRGTSEEANVINIHHNTYLNPYVNYPFVVRDTLASFIRQQHDTTRKVKLYYTIRELSNYATEIYALKSLDHEIIPAGPGGGAPWLWEHLISDYKAAWYSPFKDQRSDESVVISGYSRWINYYIEGLRWMIQHYQIDGLYLDDVAYGRDVMARIRKVAQRYNRGVLFDLHSNTRYSVGPANQYTGFFPYIDRLWFGESFRYNEMSADQWLVQFSGIPFGLMSDMLQDDGNQWLGMVYGSSIRHSWGKASPAALWKYWETFNIRDAAMTGYWEDDCPVTSNNNQVKITVYKHPDKLLLAIGNWSDTTETVTPVFKNNALNKDHVKLHAPAIAGFQEEGSYLSGEPIRVPGKKGLLLEIMTQ